MTTSFDNPQNHCATCLILLEHETLSHVITWKLRYWIFTATGFQMQVHEDEKICNWCHRTIRMAEEVRNQLQEAELQFREMQLGKGRSKFQNAHLSVCSICMHLYPQEVKKTLICHLQETPILEKWLIRWSSRKLSDNYFPREICRICLSRIRQCYEWQCFAEASSIYLNRKYKDYEDDKKAFPNVKGTRLLGGRSGSDISAFSRGTLRKEECLQLFEQVDKEHKHDMHEANDTNCSKCNNKKCTSAAHNRKRNKSELFTIPSSIDESNYSFMDSDSEGDKKAHNMLHTPSKELSQELFMQEMQKLQEDLNETRKSQAQILTMMEKLMRLVSSPGNATSSMAPQNSAGSNNNPHTLIQQQQQQHHHHHHQQHHCEAHHKANCPFKVLKKQPLARTPDEFEELNNKLTNKDFEEDLRKDLQSIRGETIYNSTKKLVKALVGTEILSKYQFDERKCDGDTWEGICNKRVYKFLISLICERHDTGDLGDIKRCLFMMMKASRNKTRLAHENEIEVF